MKKFSPLSALILVLLLGHLTSPGHAQAPALREQLVYSLNLFNGKGYTPGFAPGSEDTIYLIANENNAVSLRSTLVYFWPITGKYVAGFKALNEEIDGTLELMKDGKVTRSLEKEDNVLSYAEGFFGESSQMQLGQEARTFFRKYQEAVKDYYERVDEYYKKMEEHKKKFNEFLESLRKRREAGEKMKPAQIEEEMPIEPSPPEGIKFYVTPLRKDYILSLPQGVYQIRMRARDGTIIEDSQKNLVVFARRREGGVGYEIIPGNRWTMRENSDDPSKIIYAAGKNTLYLRPFLQDEYNELYYQKLLDPQNEGTPERWMWVHTSSLENVLLSFLKKGKLLERIKKAPYYVKQIPGPELGYEILEYKEEEFLGRAPTFEGHKLDLSPVLEKGNYQLRLEKREGEVLKGSERKILLVRKENANLLYLISIFPLVVGSVVFIQRKRLTS